MYFLPVFIPFSSCCFFLLFMNVVYAWEVGWSTWQGRLRFLDVFFLFSFLFLPTWSCCFVRFGGWLTDYLAFCCFSIFLFILFVVVKGARSVWLVLLVRVEERDVYEEFKILCNFFVFILIVSWFMTFSKNKIVNLEIFIRNRICTLMMTVCK